MKLIDVFIRIDNMDTITAQDDSELIIKSQKGDLTSFSYLVKRYQNDIVNFAGSFSKDGDLAEDASQETFIKLYKNIHKIDSNKPLKPWLYTVAKNYCLDTFRKKKRNVPLLENLPAQGETLIDKLIKKDEILAILTALKRLPTKYRVTLYARFFEGLSYQEISGVLQIPLNTIKTNIKRGKELLFIYTENYV
jgi:RNA polymerase sigma-70 factor (ECF subfamily)